MKKTSKAPAIISLVLGITALCVSLDGMLCAIFLSGIPGSMLIGVAVYAVFSLLCAIIGVLLGCKYLNSDAVRLLSMARVGNVLSMFSIVATVISLITVFLTMM